MWKCVGPSGLPMRVCSRRACLGAGQAVFLSQQQAWHFQFCFCLYNHPLHAHIKSDDTVLLLQLPAADNFSRINVRSTTSKVLDKWFRVPTKREFQQSLSTDERCHLSEASCLWGAEGHWLVGPSDHHCDRMGPRALQGAGLTPLVV